MTPEERGGGAGTEEAEWGSPSCCQRGAALALARNKECFSKVLQGAVKMSRINDFSVSFQGPSKAHRVTVRACG